MSSLYIQAMNVHTGGGASLLISLLKVVSSQKNVILLVDERMKEIPTDFFGITIKRIKPKLLSRLAAEFWLQSSVKKGDVVLCFGNLPPIRPLKGQVFVFIQNRLLIENVGLELFSIKTRLRLSIERKWISFFSHHASSFIVQTPSMQKLLSKFTGLDTTAISVLPFIDNPIFFKSLANNSGSNREKSDINSCKYIYPASGDPHKNHIALLQSWIILAKNGFFPTLFITIDTHKYRALYIEIEKKIREFNLRIFNLGFLSHVELLSKYKETNALIFPSLIESFGIPLLEARSAGLAILASELDYVRDILDPDESFNPSSPNSIALAVQRHHSVHDNGLSLLGPKDFLDEILLKNKTSSKLV